MERIYLQKMFEETLSEDEKEVMAVASVICREGLDVEVLYNLYMPNSPHLLYDIVDSLCVRDLLFREHKRICCNKEISDAVLEVASVNERCLENLLMSLEEYLSVGPLDDYLARQQYFVAARLLLGYIMETWEDMIETTTAFDMALKKNLVNFASNAELSFYRSNRQPVCRLEERIDYKLLRFSYYVPSVANYNALLGSLYSNIFMYDEAWQCLSESELFFESDPVLSLAFSEMYWNLSQTARSFQYAYKAYMQNLTDNNPDNNIYVCLYLSRLCGLYDIEDSCKSWLQKGKELIGKRRIPAIHPIRIMLLEIEALLTKDNLPAANDVLDKAQLMAVRLYGANSPALIMVSYIRYAVYTEIGMSRKAIEAYRDYVDLNHFNYGYSPADLSVLYSAIIDSNNERGCFCTSDIYEARMLELHSEPIPFAPGVRFSKAFSEATNCLVSKDYDLCAFYIENARNIFLQEIKPDDRLIDSIRPVFEGGVVPDAVLGKYYERAVSSGEFEIELGRGEYSAARERVLNEISNEANSEERLMLSVRLGRIAIKEGNTEEGVRHWRNVISQADASCKFEIAKDIAEWAAVYELHHEAKEFYETALQAEYMIYAKTKDLAVALRNYAEALELYGQQDKSDESWQQAVDLFKATNDFDGLALAYWYWGTTKQDCQAEVLLKRAIKYWERESGIFDETLSHIYREYASNQGMLGNMEEARAAAKKAVSLYPSYYPDYLAEEIEEYL